MSMTEGELTSIALCWRLERMDGAGLALTSHDQSVLSGGVEFEPAPGMMPASITKSLGLEPDSSEVAGALSSSTLDEGDLALGRWDGAAVRLSAIDWNDPDAEAVDLLGGEIGSVSIRGEGFSADLIGAAARLDEPACPATSSECRARFGDKRCRVDLTGRTVIATVVAAAGTEITVDREVDDRFVFGRLRYMSGANCGLTSVILAADGSSVQVRDLPRKTVEAGCRIEIREGCDKRFETCVNRFGNAANFRGEPHLPGTDYLTRYPGA